MCRREHDHEIINLFLPELAPSIQSAKPGSSTQTGGSPSTRSNALDEKVLNLQAQRLLLEETVALTLRDRDRIQKELVEARAQSQRMEDRLIRSEGELAQAKERSKLNREQSLAAEAKEKAAVSRAKDLQEENKVMRAAAIRRNDSYERDMEKMRTRVDEMTAELLGHREAQEKEVNMWKKIVHNKEEELRNLVSYEKRKFLVVANSDTLMSKKLPTKPTKISARIFAAMNPPKSQRSPAAQALHAPQKSPTKSAKPQQRRDDVIYIDRTPSPVPEEFEYQTQISPPRLAPPPAKRRRAEESIGAINLVNGKPKGAVQTGPRRSRRI
jgi:hypothetical protein